MSLRLITQKEEYLTWDGFDQAIKAIVFYIKQNKWKFDYIVAIPRGGLTMGVKLSHLLKIPVYWDFSNIPNKSKILLIDDVSDTGRTLTLINKYLELRNEIKTITLYKKPHTKFNPDFWVFETKKWIIYPWEE